MTAPPSPSRSRWAPLRLGLVELFHYDYQEFWFRDGRLLLRGNNGTGKSKVLALTLPLLLDADLSPHRVEPDGDAAKRMEWNLLLDGAYEDRVGYTWMEFGRLTSSGEAEFLTLGIGLKAVRGRGVADRWFFVTTQRMGQGLHLIGPTGTVLTRERVEEAIGGHGQVLRTGEAYRRAVDERLFHLGTERYESLMDLLVQLRQPQLSKRPDEARLSQALSQALPPIDQAILADVAAALHDLEQQREELAALRDAREHVERFLRRYSAYAKVASRREARTVRTAQSEADRHGRDLAELRGQAQAHADQADETSIRKAALAERIAELEAVREELAGNPDLADRELRRDNAATAARHAREAGEHVERQRAAARTAKERLDRAQREAAQQARLVEAVTDELLRVALASGLQATQEAHVAPAGRVTTAAVRALEDAAARRLAACDQVARLVEAVRTAQVKVADELRRLSDREAERDAARDRDAAAQAGLLDAVTATVAAWRSFVATLTVCTPEHPDDVGLADWSLTLDGPNPAQRAVVAAVATAEESLAADQAQCREERRGHAGRLAQLEDERRTLVAEAFLPPPGAPTRDAAARAGRPGAPLWQLVEFHADLGDGDRAGLEAALDASGLLDAWVWPDGMVTGPNGVIDDAVVGCGPGVEPSLADALRPGDHLPDGAPSAEVVRRVLGGIGLGPSDPGAQETSPGQGQPGQTWVGLDGRFGLGVLTGHWHKASAEFLGTLEREAARQRRLSELAAGIAGLQAAISAVDARLVDLGAQVEAIRAVRSALPTDDALRQAHAARRQAARDVTAKQDDLDRQVAAVEEARAAAGEATLALDEAATDLALPVDPAGLQAVRDAARDYPGRLNDLRREGERLAEVLVKEAEGAADLADATAQLQTLTESHRQAVEEAGAARARLAALEESMGGTLDDLKARHDSAVRDLRATKDEHGRTATALEEAKIALAGVSARIDLTLAIQQEQQQRRDGAVEAFRAFAATGLLVIALPDLEFADPLTAWAADPTVRLTRRVEQALEDVDDGESAWQRVQDDVTRQFSQLSEALSRHGHHASMELRADRFVAMILYQGRERDPAALAGLLEDEVAHRDRLLSAKERELLEEHLVNDVAGHLQELITEAESQVAAMNAELAERPTSTGMLLRLQWQVHPEGPEGLAQARTHLLRQTSQLWSAQDRAAVSTFLAQQIERERTAHEQGTWHESLARALDYRAWHRFAIERYQDGRWRPGTGPASGGERVLTVSLPLFAAASAHYRSAHRDAPRLVMLDEAFAGVDDDSRAKCLGLLATFDLDVVMTSEREWGFYATVPGIATHQLVRRDGIDAVHVSSWEWDGVGATPMDQQFSAQAPQPRRELGDLDEAGLF